MLAARGSSGVDPGAANHRVLIATSAAQQKLPSLYELNWRRSRRVPISRRLTVTFQPPLVWPCPRVLACFTAWVLLDTQVH
jgi:hypothetical protein